jgi:hypothetical protein
LAKQEIQSLTLWHPPGRLGGAISEVAGQISRISLNFRPETGSLLTSGSSIPSKTATQSGLFTDFHFRKKLNANSGG